MRRTGLLVATMLTALLKVSGVASAKEWIGTPKNDRYTGTERDEVFSACGGTEGRIASTAASAATTR